MNDQSPRPDVASFIALASDTPIRLEDIGAQTCRQMMRELAKTGDIPANPSVACHDLSIGRADGGGIGARLYRPTTNARPGDLLIYFHGGGFVAGDLETHHSLCSEIAASALLPVLAVDYRCAPDHPWPAALIDCEAVASWVVSMPEALGTKVSNIILGGDSAGAWLAISVARKMREISCMLQPSLLWLLYPLVDLDCDLHQSFQQFRNGPVLTAEAMDWFVGCFAVPLDSVRNLSQLDQTGIPSIFICTAELDPLRDQGRELASACTRAGVPTVYLEAKGQVHGFAQTRLAIPSARQDLASCVQFLRVMSDHVVGDEAVTS